MWSRPGPSAERLGLLLAALLVSCGGGKGEGPRARPPGPQIARRFDPAEIIPADLDLVVRIDVARMRSGIGPAAADALEERALRGAGKDVIADAVACGDVVWLGARLGDLDGGDHVVVVEGKYCAPDLKPPAWEKVASNNAEIKIFQRKGEGAPRAGTERVIALGPRITAFVSPIERDSVSRVLRDGPDARRGNPTAEGIVSVDLRAGRLPPALERKFPSIGAIAGGLERIRGSAVLVDEGVRVDLDVVSPTPRGAARALKFLEALRDNVADPRLADVMKTVHVEQIEHTVQVRLVLPAKVVLALLSAEGAATRDAP